MSRDPHACELWPAFTDAPSVVCAAPILVIDDDPQQLQAMTSILRASRLAVAAARSGAEALVRASVQRPELLIIEATLHGASSAPTLAVLRELVPDAAVIVTSALPATDPRIAALLARARASYLPKPVERERLLARLRRALLAGATPRR